MPCTAVSHLVAQCHDIGILPGVGAREDGLLKHLRGVGMYKVIAVGTKHHEVGVLVGMLGGDSLGEFPQRQVGRDDSDEFSLPVMQWYTIGGNHFRT